jgi:hypothetical protein
VDLFCRVNCIFEAHFYVFLDYAWHAATNFGISTQMPFISQASHLAGFDPSQLNHLDTHHQKMGMKMDIKNEVGFKNNFI